MSNADCGFCAQAGSFRYLGKFDIILTTIELDELHESMVMPADLSPEIMDEKFEGVNVMPSSPLLNSRCGERACTPSRNWIVFDSIHPLCEHLAAEIKWSVSAHRILPSLMITSEKPSCDTDSKSATIVTGAGSGLGRAITEALSRRGRPVMLVGRREDRLIETRARCLRSGAPSEACRIVVADLTEDGAAEYVVTETLGHFDTIGALVNNAGLAHFGSLELSDVSDWRRMIETNLLGPARLIKSATPALRKSQGAVVNVASIGGVLALPGRAVYGASKAALAHLTRSLARELAPEIRVNAILPGAIETDMYDHLGLDSEEVSALRSEMVGTTPLGRMGSVDDVVPWIDLLLGPAGSWVTGSLFIIDGGRSC